MAEPDGIRASVVYAEPERVWQRELTVPVGTNVAQAIERSGFAASHPDVAVNAGQVGVYGRRTNMDHILRDGDRVEIYRPLKQDPMTARRLRAAQR